MKEKKRLIIIIIILSILLVLAGGYIAYDKLFLTEEPTNNQTNSQENIEQEDEVNKDLIVKNLTNLLPRIKSLHKYETKIDDFNKISNQDKLSIVGEYLASRNGENLSEYFTSSKFSSVLKTEGFEKIFKNVTYKNEDFNCCEDRTPVHCHILYTEENDLYTTSGENGHGGASGPELFGSKLIEFKKNNNQYELTFINYFVSHDEYGYYNKVYTKYIPDNEAVITVEESSVDEHDAHVAKLKKAIEEHKETLTNYDAYPKYKYIIELDENNNPLLVGYEFIEAK